MTEPSDVADDLMDLAPISKDMAIRPEHGVAALALNFALKYHDIGTVQDGTLYQQFKLEGKNLTPLHLDLVFETALRIEQHILSSPNRMSEMFLEGVVETVVGAIKDALSGEEEPDAEPPARTTP